MSADSRKVCLRLFACGDLADSVRRLGFRLALTRFAQDDRAKRLSQRNTALGKGEGCGVSWQSRTAEDSRPYLALREKGSIAAVSMV